MSLVRLEREAGRARAYLRRLQQSVRSVHQVAGRSLEDRALLSADAVMAGATVGGDPFAVLLGVLARLELPAGANGADVGPLVSRRSSPGEPRRGPTDRGNLADSSARGLTGIAGTDTARTRVRVIGGALRPVSTQGFFADTVSASGPARPRTTAPETSAGQRAAIYSDPARAAWILAERFRAATVLDAFRSAVRVPAAVHLGAADPRRPRVNADGERAVPLVQSEYAGAESFGLAAEHVVPIPRTTHPRAADRARLAEADHPAPEIAAEAHSVATSLSAIEFEAAERNAGNVAAIGLSAAGLSVAGLSATEPSVEERIDSASGAERRGGAGRTVEDLAGVLPSAVEHDGAEVGPAGREAAELAGAGLRTTGLNPPGGAAAPGSGPASGPLAGAESPRPASPPYARGVPPRPVDRRFERPLTGLRRLAALATESLEPGPSASALANDNVAPAEARLDEALERLLRAEARAHGIDLEGIVR